MIHGLDKFREAFRGYEDSFVLIGGAACEDWFTRRNLTFRATKDLDVVLILEVIDNDFVAAVRSFIAEGAYDLVEQSEQVDRVLYRFSKPQTDGFPAMLELFSRGPEGINLGPGQKIVPITNEDGSHSLSAILLDDDYYYLVRNELVVRDGIAFANVTSLIPLKAKAWLNLTQEETAGVAIDAKNIKKHRADVFRLAGTLPDERGPELALTIRNDLSRFLAEFPTTSSDWHSIVAALKPTLGKIEPEDLIEAIRKYFQL